MLVSNIYGGFSVNCDEKMWFLVLQYFHNWQYFNDPEIFVISGLRVSKVQQNSVSTRDSKHAGSSVIL